VSVGTNNFEEYIVYYLKDSYLENQLENPFEEKHNAIVNTSFNINSKAHLNLNENNIKISSGFTNSSIYAKHPSIYSARETPYSQINNINMFFAHIGNKIVGMVNTYYCNKKQVVEFSEFIVNVELEPRIVINQLLIKMTSYYASLAYKIAYNMVPDSSLMINDICVENGFEFGGRLTNELVFKGKFDSLNTWFKQL